MIAINLPNQPEGSAIVRALEKLRASSLLIIEVLVFRFGEEWRRRLL